MNFWGHFLHDSKILQRSERTIAGNWFVFIFDIGIEDYDFPLTRVRGGDFIAFSLDNKNFQICGSR